MDRRRALVSTLSTGGFVAPEEEADELLARAGHDDVLLDALVRRRLTGEPLAWITGRVSFCDLELGVDAGVYVPRWQTEQLARRAVELLPPAGTAVDLCTGTGAIARVLLAARRRTERGWWPRTWTSGPSPAPGATVSRRITATCSPRCRAASKARSTWSSRWCPYVPTPALPLLQRDTLTFESPLSYDGGPDGTDILRRVLAESPRYLRPGGTVLVELGGEEADALTGDLSRLGYVDVALLLDDDDDVRGLEATWST